MSDNGEGLDYLARLRAIDDRLESAYDVYISYRHNPRLLEANLYPLWNLLLIIIFDHMLNGNASQKNSYVITPQWPIWIAPHEVSDSADQDPDLSFSTITAADAVGVLVDYAVLITSTTVRQTRLFVPILVEIKRSPSRSLSITKWGLSLATLLSNARTQAIQQAMLLFMSKRRDPAQTKAFVVAVSGDWYTVQLITRTEVDIAIKKYLDLALYEGDSLDTFTAQDHYLAFRQLNNRLKYEEIFKCDEEDEVATTEQQRKDDLKRRHKEERDARARRRRDEQVSQAAFAELHAPYDYTELDLYAQHHSGLGNPPLTAFSHQLSPGHDREQLLTRGKWSRPIQLGSPASNTYLQLMKEITAEWAREWASNS